MPTKKARCFADLETTFLGTAGSSNISQCYNECCPAHCQFGCLLSLPIWQRHISKCILNVLNLHQVLLESSSRTSRIQWQKFPLICTAYSWLMYTLYIHWYFFFLYSLTFSSCHFSFPSFPFCSFWAWVKLAQPLSYYGFSSPLVVLLALLSISFQCRLFFSWILSKSTADQSHTQHFIWGIWLGAMNNTKLPFSLKWLHWSCISP